MNELHQQILSILLFCPFVGAIVTALMPRQIAREFGLAVAGVNFLFSLHLWRYWSQVADGAAGFKFEQSVPWLPQFGLTYHLGVDGLSVFLVLLTTFLTPLAMLGAWNVAKRTKEFMVCLLLLEAALIGVFCALDVLLFYMFYEGVLIPAFILILGWGGARRNYAAIKFFLYTLVGGLLMWVGILYVYLPGKSSSFDYPQFKAAANALDAADPNGIGTLLFGAFALAFAIKTPLFPLHSWQPDAYDEAPTPAAVMLAGVMTKMGTYGFVRFALPFFPNAATAAAPLFVGLSLAAIVYGALVAVRQTNLKRLIAYSSLSHLGFIVLGIFAALLIRPNSGSTFGPNGDVVSQSANIAISGATIQMVSHGLSTGALFLLLAFLFERRATSEMRDFGGLAAPMPRYTVLFWVALFSSIGLPGLSGFVGEYLILQGSMAANFWYALIAATGVIWGAVYMLRMFRRVAFGEVSETNRTLPDVNTREWVAVGLVLAASLWIGVAPQGFLNIINPDANKVAPRAAQSTLMAPELAQSTLDEVNTRR